MNGAAIVQGDRSVLLEVAHPGFEQARGALAAFAELEKSPEHVHTYRISAVSLWNAAAAGLGADEIADTLVTMSRCEVPQAVLADVRNLCARYGRLRLLEGDGGLLRLVADTPALLAEVARAAPVTELLRGRPSASEATLAPVARGLLKQALIALGWPVEDLAPYEDGDPLAVELADDLEVRAYQRDAAATFAASGAGVVVLPCGAGKTIVGLAAIAEQGSEALIVTSNAPSVQQWQRGVGAAVAARAGAAHDRRRRGDRRVLGPRQADPPDHDHHLPDAHPSPEPRRWLPASRSVRQARLGARDLRRGPPLARPGVPRDGTDPGAPAARPDRDADPRGRRGAARVLAGGAQAIRHRVARTGGRRLDRRRRELRVPLGAEQRMVYALADERERFVLASRNPAKEALVATVLEHHPSSHALVIGYYVEQLERIADRLGAPLVTGKTPRHEREELYDRFRGLG